MTRVEAEAITQLRAFLVLSPNLARASLDDLATLRYGFRPNRSLPRPFRVVSFFVFAGVEALDQRFPPTPLDEQLLYSEEFRCVDKQMKVLTPALMNAFGVSTQSMRWRVGGVLEWDGLIVDTNKVQVSELIEAKLSKMLFGDTRVLNAEEL